MHAAEQNAAQVADPGSANDASWCAVHTRHQHEGAVARILNAKGVEVFLPTYKTVHRWKDRNKQLELPLFPGYVFFAYEAERRVLVLSTPGVHAILATGKNQPAVIPTEQISAIRRAVESPLLVQPHPYLKGGDVVRIRSGPLEGLEGVVSRSKDAFRVVLSVEMLGKSAAVELDACAVESIRSRAVRPS